MDSKSLKTLTIIFLTTVALLWVLARPLGALGLFIYQYSGAFANSFVTNIFSSKNFAQDFIQALEKVKELNKENKKLIIENKILKSHLKEMKSLQKTLNFANNFTYQTIPAKVRGRSPDSWHRQIIIDKGSKDGIKLGKGVITELGIVGQVKKVSKDSSIIQIANDPKWRMGIKIASLNQYGVISGNYPNLPQIQFVTLDSEVQPGDKILSSGICLDQSNCSYPDNYPVATVVDVIRDPNEVDLVIKVKYNQDLSKLSEVCVLK